METDFLALLYAMFSCEFVTCPYDILGQVWSFIVLIPDICLLPYLNGISLAIFVLFDIGENYF